jgi:hypothetical protein
MIRLQFTPLFIGIKNYGRRFNFFTLYSSQFGFCLYFFLYSHSALAAKFRFVIGADNMEKRGNPNYVGKMTQRASGATGHTFMITLASGVQLAEVLNT